MISAMDKNAVRRDFSRAAQSYDTHAALQRDIVHQAIALCRGRIPDGALVLDAGCGTGYLSRHLRKQGIDWRLVQCDIAEEMCRVARKSSNSELLHATVCTDLTALPLADASVDAVFSSLCLQWVTDPAAALLEIRRVLKPGGIAMLTTFGPATLRELRKAYLALDMEPHVHDFLPLKTLITHAEAAGLNFLHAKVEVIPHLFPDLLVLLRTLKGLGAAYKSPREPGMHGRSFLKRLAENYGACHKNGEAACQATFETFYMQFYA